MEESIDFHFGGENIIELHDGSGYTFTSGAFGEISIALLRKQRLQLPQQQHQYQHNNNKEQQQDLFVVVSATPTTHDVHNCNDNSNTCSSNSNSNNDIQQDEFLLSIVAVKTIRNAYEQQPQQQQLSKKYATTIVQEESLLPDQENPLMPPPVPRRRRQLHSEVWNEMMALKILNNHHHPNIIILEAIYNNQLSSSTTIPTSISIACEYCPLDLHVAIQHYRFLRRSGKESERRYQLLLLEQQQQKSLLKTQEDDEDKPEQHSFSLYSSYLPISIIQTITYDIIHALQHCHQHHILHCDIKPSNIVLSYHGVLKLCDFGLAQHMDDPKTETKSNHDPSNNNKNTKKMKTKPNGLCMLQYRPPELLLGGGNDHFQKKNDRIGSVDIYSFGIVLLELLVVKEQSIFYAMNELDQIQLIYKYLVPPPPISPVSPIPVVEVGNTNHPSKDHDDDWKEYYQQLPHGHLLLRDKPTAATTTSSSDGLHVFQEELADYIPRLKENNRLHEFINCMVHVHPMKRFTCTELLHHRYMKEFVVTSSSNVDVDNVNNNDMYHYNHRNRIEIRKELMEPLLLQPSTSSSTYSSYNEPPWLLSLHKDPELKFASKQVSNVIHHRKNLIQNFSHYSSWTLEETVAPK